MEKARGRGDNVQLVVSPRGSSQMAPAGTQEVNGVRTRACREPSPAAGLMPGPGRQEGTGIRVWAEASHGAFGQFVTLADPDDDNDDDDDDDDSSL